MNGQTVLIAVAVFICAVEARSSAVETSAPPPAGQAGIPGLPRPEATAGAAELYAYAEQLRKAGNLTEAEEWYGKSADMGCHDAMNALGCLLLEKKPAEAIRLLKAAAAAGNAKAQYNCYQLATSGHMGICSDAEALQNLKASAEAGHKPAQFEWGLQCLLKEDNATGFRFLKSAADGPELESDASLQYALGECYLRGVGTDKNLSAARSCFTRAASMHHPKAQYMLSKLVFRGEGGSKDEVQALSLMKAAALGGLSAAKLEYGVCLVNGIGTPADIPAGIAMIKEAADDGVPQAQYTYAGIWTSEGLKGMESPPKAVLTKYLKQSADKGYGPALYDLGRHYFMENNNPAGFRCLLQASSCEALKDNPSLLYYLGKCYAEGIGTKQDAARAKEYMERAARQEFEPAKEWLSGKR